MIGNAPHLLWSLFHWRTGPLVLYSLHEKGSSYQTAFVQNLPIVSDQRLRNDRVRVSFLHDKGLISSGGLSWNLQVFIFLVMLSWSGSRSVLASWSQSPVAAAKKISKSTGSERCRRFDAREPEGYSDTKRLSDRARKPIQGNKSDSILNYLHIEDNK